MSANTPGLVSNIGMWMVEQVVEWWEADKSIEILVAEVLCRVIWHIAIRNLVILLCINIDFGELWDNMKATMTNAWFLSSYSKDFYIFTFAVELYAILWWAFSKASCGFPSLRFTNDKLPNIIEISSFNGNLVFSSSAVSFSYPGIKNRSNASL